MESIITQVTTVSTSIGDLPMPQVFDAEGLSVLSEPQVGGFALAPVRGRMRTVRIEKVTPKRVTVVCTTPTAMEEAGMAAIAQRTPGVEGRRAHDLKTAKRYREQADAIERLGIAPTEGNREAGQSSDFVSIDSLPAEYRVFEEARGTNVARTCIVWRPATLRAWADDIENAEAVARYEQRLAEAREWDALPAAERVRLSVTTTEKIVKREQVFALPEAS